MVRSKGVAIHIHISMFNILVAGNEMGRIYHRRWDVQDGKWQLLRWEDEFTTGEGPSKMGSGR